MGSQLPARITHQKQKQEALPRSIALLIKLENVQKLAVSLPPSSVKARSFTLSLLLIITMTTSHLKNDCLDGLALTVDFINFGERFLAGRAVACSADPSR